MCPHFVILGAGISGLATAWYLKKALGSDCKITILEKSDRTGGWIQTIEKEGFLLEQGPRSCRTKGAQFATLKLVEDLKLEDQVLKPHADAKYRYIYHQHKLKKLPSHLWQLPFNSLTSDAFKALWRDGQMPKRLAEDESIQDFFSRRLGKRWSDELVDPFVSGIYAGDCSRLSLKSCFPLLDAWEQKEGSLLKGAWRESKNADPSSPFIQSMQDAPLFSFKKGMETLPQALTQSLNEHIHLNQKIKKLKVTQEGIELESETGQTMQADYVISTLPAYALSVLLKDSSLSEQLQSLHYTTVAVVNMGFEGAILPLKGFGYLIPSSLKMASLGCVWDSCVFPGQNKGNQTRLAVMVGGRHHPEVEEFSEERLIDQAYQTLKEHLGISVKAKAIQVKVAKKAIPQFEVGFSKWKQAIKDQLILKWPRLILNGTAESGVSLNDCILQAQELSKKLLKEIKLEII